ncbi:MAG: DUF1826 domain-containing protein [Paracoccus sp. (in: a-proteobacteria)]|nr:DUF1826 domain-containing protein [Paracoccus sp. (in: a-proteobacteria)]
MTSSAPLAEAKPATIMRQVPACGIHAGPDAQALDRITDPGCALALWWHRPAPAFQAWMDAIPEAALPRLRATVTLDEVAQVVHAACDEAGTPDGRHRAALSAHIVDLASRFSRVMGCRRLALRLDAGRGQACPKWHLDAVEARLLSSLRGPGTEFAPLRNAGADHAEPGDIQQMRTGEVGLFRGRGWRGGPPAILHRSPPAGRDKARLLLVMDPLR